MAGHMLLLLMFSAPAEADWSGMLATVAGQVTIERDGTKYAARPAAGIRSGDVVRTIGQGSAAIYLFDTAAIRLGPNTQVTLVRGDEIASAWQLHRGEMRVTVSDEAKATISTDNGEAIVRNAILRIYADADAERYQVEHGRVRLTAADEIVSLSRGAAVQLFERGGTAIATRRTFDRQVQTAGYTEKPGPQSPRDQSWSHPHNRKRRRATKNSSRTKVATNVARRQVPSIAAGKRVSPPSSTARHSALQFRASTRKTQPSSVSTAKPPAKITRPSAALLTLKQRRQNEQVAGRRFKRLPNAGGAASVGRRSPAVRLLDDL